MSAEDIFEYGFILDSLTEEEIEELFKEEEEYAKQTTTSDLFFN